jgi:hypothetical protein
MRPMPTRFPFEEDFRFRCGEFHKLRHRYIFIGSRPHPGPSPAIDPVAQPAAALSAGAIPISPSDSTMREADPVHSGEVACKETAWS